MKKGIYQFRGFVLEGEGEGEGEGDDEGGVESSRGRGRGRGRTTGRGRGRGRTTGRGRGCGCGRGHQGGLYVPGSQYPVRTVRRRVMKFQIFSLFLQNLTKIWGNFATNDFFIFIYLDDMLS